MGTSIVFWNVSLSDVLPPFPSHSDSQLINYRFLNMKVLADYEPSSPSCLTVTDTTFSDCSTTLHCAQPGIMQQLAHAILCSCPSTIPTSLISASCPTKCVLQGGMTRTSTLRIVRRMRKRDI